LTAAVRRFDNREFTRRYAALIKEVQESMIAEIVSVGTELLMGQVVNSDAQFIAQRLAPLGFQVYYHTTVGDNVKRLTAVVHQAVERSDVVVFTGGLGPTDDDLTKETVAAALGLTVEPIPEEVERIKRYFEERGYAMTPNNYKQASFPRGSVILRNDFGTAPGCIMRAEDKTAILLPGPPAELFPMFLNHVMPYLERMSGNKLYSRELRIFGMGESSVTYKLRDIIESQTNPTVAPYVKTGEVTLRVTALCKDEEEGAAFARPMIDEIVSGSATSCIPRRANPCRRPARACSSTAASRSPLRKAVRAAW
jgi:nicotinamide-nucleotide amidase